MSRELILASLEEAHEGLEALMKNEEALRSVDAAGALMARTIREGGRIFSCGNGGSLCDAMHFAEEMTGRFRANRRPYAATAISDVSHMACVGNDYGFEDVFSRYIEGVARRGDVLLAISTSGTSRNILKAVRQARQMGVSVIGMTGRPGTPLALESDIAIVTPAGRFADRVQELHIKCIHIMIELVESILEKPSGD